MILEELMPWYKEQYDFSLLEVNRYIMCACMFVCVHVAYMYMHVFVCVRVCVCVCVCVGVRMCV